MMRATLTFDLPDDQDDLLHGLYGSHYFSVLWDLDQRLRSCLKHGSGTLGREDLEEIRRELYELFVLTSNG